MARNNFDEDTARRRMSPSAGQMSTALKLAKSDHIIDNSSNIENLFRQLDLLENNINPGFFRVIVGFTILWFPAVCFLLTFVVGSLCYH
jgi:pilus assembly protein TadC